METALIIPVNRVTIPVTAAQAQVTHNAHPAKTLTSLVGDNVLIHVQHSSLAIRAATYAILAIHNVYAV